MQRKTEKRDRELLAKIRKLTGYFKAAGCRGQEDAEVEDADRDHCDSSSSSKGGAHIKNGLGAHDYLNPPLITYVVETVDKSKQR